MSAPVALEVRDLSVRGPGGRTILDDVGLTLRAGQVAAVVGETGSGKTTLLNSILGLLPPGLDIVSGEVLIEDGGDRVDLLHLTQAEMRRHLGVHIGYVPQDVRAGLDPLIPVIRAVMGVAGRVPGRARERTESAMRRAGLDGDFLAGDAARRPARLSGGQCQRILISQAIVNDPRVLLLDEPTASLDPEARGDIRATIRDLIGDHRAIGLVTHDLTGLAGLADSIAVMYLGRMVEVGRAEDVLRRPRHPYTVGLLGCILPLDRRTPLSPIPGEIPADADEISGCRFHPRCPRVEGRCRSEIPRLRPIGPGREVACHVVESDPL